MKMVEFRITIIIIIWASYHTFEAFFSQDMLDPRRCPDGNFEGVLYFLLDDTVPVPVNHFQLFY